MSAINIQVDNRVRFHFGNRAVSNELIQEVKLAFTHHNPEYDRARREGRPLATIQEEIATWRVDNRLQDVMTVPRGGMQRLRDIFKRYGHEWVVDDRRVGGEEGSWNESNLWVGIDQIEHALKLYPYQEEAIIRLLTREQGILRAPTGSGKSSIAMNLIARLKVPTVVIVWSGGLMDQWVERCRKELDYDPGVIAGDRWDVRPITIAMQQTLHSRGIEEIRDLFGMVLLDEIQRAAATTVYEVVDSFPCRYRYGMSADETRKDNLEILTYDVFGDVLADIPRKQLIESRHVHDVECRVVETQFNAPWYRMASNKNLAHSRLLGQMAEDDARNHVILGTVMDEADQGEQVLVLSHRVEHCRRLEQLISAHGARRGIKTGLLLGGAENKTTFRKTIEDLKSGVVRIGVGTYACVGVGIDLPAVAVAVCCTPLHNNAQQFGQVRGRVCRIAEGKEGARLYYIYDRLLSGLAPLKKIKQYNGSVMVFKGQEWRSWSPEMEQEDASSF